MRVTAEPPQPDLTSHIEATINSLRQLRDEHHRSSSLLEQWATRITQAVSRPLALVVFVGLVVVWVVANELLPETRHAAFDPPPFFWLDGVVSLISLCLVLMVLSSQRADEELARQRELLSLELAVLSEQKTAKVIRLLEEFRRDSPQIPDRVDPEADQMSLPSHPAKVLDAIRETTEREPPN